MKKLLLLRDDRYVQISSQPPASQPPAPQPPAPQPSHSSPQPLATLFPSPASKEIICEEKNKMPGTVSSQISNIAPTQQSHLGGDERRFERDGEKQMGGRRGEMKEGKQAEERETRVEAEASRVERVWRRKAESGCDDDEGHRQGEGVWVDHGELRVMEQRERQVQMMKCYLPIEQQMVQQQQMAQQQLLAQQQHQLAQQQMVQQQIAQQHGSRKQNEQQRKPTQGEQKQIEKRQVVRQNWQGKQEPKQEQQEQQQQRDGKQRENNQQSLKQQQQQWREGQRNDEQREIEQHRWQQQSAKISGAHPSDLQGMNQGRSVPEKGELKTSTEQQQMYVVDAQQQQLMQQQLLLFQELAHQQHVQQLLHRDANQQLGDEWQLKVSGSNPALGRQDVTSSFSIAGNVNSNHGVLENTRKSFLKVSDGQRINARSLEYGSDDDDVMMEGDVSADDDSMDECSRHRASKSSSGGAADEAHLGASRSSSHSRADEYAYAGASRSSFHSVADEYTHYRATMSSSGGAVDDAYLGASRSSSQSTTDDELRRYRSLSSDSGLFVSAGAELSIDATTRSAASQSFDAFKLPAGLSPRKSVSRRGPVNGRPRASPRPSSARMDLSPGAVSPRPGEAPGGHAGGARSVIRCSLCAKQFNNSSALAKHKLTHSDERKYACAVCSKAFKRQDHLNGHMMTHNAKKPFECRFVGCGKSYCDARSLRRHLENQHQESLRGSARSQGNSDAASFRSGSEFRQSEEEEEEGYVDEGKAGELNCGGSVGGLGVKKYDGGGAVLDQGDNGGHEGEKSKLVWTLGYNPLDEPKPVQCHVCDRRFKNIPALNGHMRLHGGYTRKDSDESSLSSEQIHPSPRIHCEELSPGTLPPSNGDQLLSISRRSSATSSGGVLSDRPMLVHQSATTELIPEYGSYPIGYYEVGNSGVKDGSGGGRQFLSALPSVSEMSAFVSRGSTSSSVVARGSYESQELAIRDRKNAFRDDSKRNEGGSREYKRFAGSQSLSNGSDCAEDETDVSEALQDSLSFLSTRLSLRHSAGERLETLTSAKSLQASGYKLPDRELSFKVANDFDVNAGRQERQGFSVSNEQDANARHSFATAPLGYASDHDENVIETQLQGVAGKFQTPEASARMTKPKREIGIKLDEEEREKITSVEAIRQPNLKLPKRVTETDTGYDAGQQAVLLSSNFSADSKTIRSQSIEVLEKNTERTSSVEKSVDKVGVLSNDRSKSPMDRISITSSERVSNRSDESHNSSSMSFTHREKESLENSRLPSNKNLTTSKGTAISDNQRIQIWLEESSPEIPDLTQNPACHESSTCCSSEVQREKSSLKFPDQREFEKIRSQGGVKIFVYQQPATMTQPRMQQHCIESTTQNGICSCDKCMISMEEASRMIQSTNNESRRVAPENLILHLPSVAPAEESCGASACHFSVPDAPDGSLYKRRLMNLQRKQGSSISCIAAQTSLAQTNVFFSSSSQRESTSNSDVPECRGKSNCCSISDANENHPTNRVVACGCADDCCCVTMQTHYRHSNNSQNFGSQPCTPSYKQGCANPCECTINNNRVVVQAECGGGANRTTYCSEASADRHESKGHPHTPNCSRHPRSTGCSNLLDCQRTDHQDYHRSSSMTSECPRSPFLSDCQRITLNPICHKASTVAAWQNCPRSPYVTDCQRGPTTPNCQRAAFISDCQRSPYVPDCQRRQFAADCPSNRQSCSSMARHPLTPNCLKPQNQPCIHVYPNTPSYLASYPATVCSAANHPQSAMNHPAISQTGRVNCQCRAMNNHQAANQCNCGKNACGRSMDSSQSCGMVQSCGTETLHAQNPSHTNCASGMHACGNRTPHVQCTPMHNSGCCASGTPSFLHGSCAPHSPGHAHGRCAPNSPSNTHGNCSAPHTPGHMSHHYNSHTPSHFSNHCATAHTPNHTHGNCSTPHANCSTPHANCSTPHGNCSTPHIHNRGHCTPHTPFTPARVYAQTPTSACHFQFPPPHAECGEEPCEADTAAQYGCAASHPAARHVGQGSDLGAVHERLENQLQQQQQHQQQQRYSAYEQQQHQQKEHHQNQQQQQQQQQAQQQQAQQQNQLQQQQQQQAQQQQKQQLNQLQQQQQQQVQQHSTNYQQKEQLQINTVAEITKTRKGETSQNLTQNCDQNSGAKNRTPRAKPRDKAKLTSFPNEPLSPTIGTQRGYNGGAATPERSRDWRKNRKQDAILEIPVKAEVARVKRESIETSWEDIPEKKFKIDCDAVSEDPSVWTLGKRETI